MRETRSWIFLGVGLLLAALTGLSLYGVAQQNVPAQQTSAAKTVEIVVAKSDLPIRTVITAAVITRKSYPPDLVPAGAITNDADAIGLGKIMVCVRRYDVVSFPLRKVF